MEIANEVEDPLVVQGVTGIRYYDPVRYTLPVSGGQITVCGLITGCGAAQMYGISMIKTECLKENKELFEKIKQEAKTRGIGGIIATTGHYNRASAASQLIPLGFILIAEYHCWHHNTTEMQSMWMLRT